MALLKEGDKIKMKVPMLSGWKGFGIVKEDQLPYSDTIRFAKCDALNEDSCYAGRNQMSKVRENIK